MQKYIVGNLKMNILSLAELDRYFEFFKSEIRGKRIKNTKIVLCPPVVYLKDFINELKGKKVSIGAQDVCWEKSGPFTGEISPLMIKNLGGEYVIIGHSERRKNFGETNGMINLKLKASVKERLEVIFCFGETIEERGAGITSEVISNQISEGLDGISISGMEKIIFAYEPVWAIGTDSIPSSNGIMEIKILIKKILTEKYGAKIAQRSVILYGGSVKEKTLKQVCLDPGMDGVLIGRECLDPHELVKIATLLDS